MSLTLIKVSPAFTLVLLLLLHAAQSRVVKTANCHEDVSLPCLGTSTTNFVSVMWYKIHKKRKEGIIRKHQCCSKPEVFISSPPVVFGEEYSLMLLNVTPEASGSYECAQNAKIGGQNMKAIVELVVNVCVTQGSTVMTTTHSEEFHQDGAQELPLAWSLAGCGALGLIKIIFSLITVQVIGVLYRERWAALHDGCYPSCLFFTPMERSLMGRPLHKRGEERR